MGRGPDSHRLEEALENQDALMGIITVINDEEKKKN
jgi:hypothetical protein